MSNLTRTSALTRSVLAAISGKKGSRLEEERPEDLEEEENAEGTEDDTSAEDNVTDPEAEAEEEDTSAETDEEQTDEGKTSANAIRRAEQGRIRSILTHPKAESNPGLASELAFGSKFYSAKDAGALLASASAGGTSLGARMAGKTPKLGAGTPGSGKSAERQAVIAGIGNTIKAIHGRNRKGA
ncbi:hypothetical protein IB279_02875 [Ensifer sp. ENS06]|uniref:hypothetical protein n=1 Tax=Ensifer sp. ENS06 TaxID=2769276 RepID=UPI001780938B|nr:hypothetical protein [Ensifer sp. ENS06]MBD9621882.1 hypothetical protein [Ensifer sp. ENS06]